MLKKCWKSQNPLSQESKRSTELEEHALSGFCHNVMHTKYSINNKTAWFLVRNSDFVEIEQMINNIFISF